MSQILIAQRRSEGEAGGEDRPGWQSRWAPKMGR